MSLSVRRLLVCLLACLTLATTALAPARAADPTPTPDPDSVATAAPVATDEAPAPIDLDPSLAPGVHNAATTDADSHGQMVIMGDSYSSGNGAGDYENYLACWRSPHNYGRQAATTLGMQYLDVSCGGGVLADITRPRDLKLRKIVTKTYRIRRGSVPDRAEEFLRRAQADQLCGTPQSADWYWKYTVVAPAPTTRLYTATVRCQLMANPQVEAVTPETDTVVLTMGGNDLDFFGLVMSCFIGRGAFSCQSAAQKSLSRLDKLETDTVDALAAAYEASDGNADIYLLSYPNLVNTDSYTLPEGPAGWYDAGAELYAGQAELDARQQRAIDSLNARYGTDAFHFVQVKDTWGLERGMDPRIGGDQSASWIVAPFSTLDVAGYVHPNRSGWEGTTRALVEAMRAEGSAGA